MQSTVEMTNNINVLGDCLILIISNGFLIIYYGM